MAGSKRSASRRKRGYWSLRKEITTRNVLHRLRRHMERHPRDEVARNAAKRRGIK